MTIILVFVVKELILLIRVFCCSEVVHNFSI